MIRRLGRIVASWFGGFRPPTGVKPFTEDGEIQTLVYHIHQWGACKYNGQYWYARCVVTESCTARIAC